MQRRTFLKRGLFGGLILAAGGVGVALIPGDRSVRPTGPLHSIHDRAFPVLAAVAARVLAGTTADPATIAMNVDNALRFAPPEAQKDVNAALLLLENALPGVVFRGRPIPFTQLDELGQDQALHGWRDSRLVLLRGAYHALRKLCLAAHWATPQSWPEAGYPGPSVPKAEPKPIIAREALHTPEVNEVLP